MILNYFMTMSVIIGAFSGVLYFGFNRTLESYINPTLTFNFWHLTVPVIASVLIYKIAELKIVLSTANSYVRSDKGFLVKSIGANLALYILLVIVSVPTSFNTWIYVFVHLIPMFIITTFLFQGLNLRIASEFKKSDYAIKSIVDLNLHNIKRLDDKNITRFLSAVNSEMQNYFIATDLLTGESRFRPLSSLKNREYLIAFNDLDVYIFDISRWGNKIIGYTVARRRHVEILNTKSKMYKWINIELRIKRESLEIDALTENKIINRQKESVEKFIDIFKA